MKIIKLALLICFSTGAFYQMAKPIGGCSQFKIPQGTFDTKIVSQGNGAILIFNNSVFCYKCTGIITMASAEVKKIVECKAGDCKETVFNTQTGEQIAPKPINPISDASKNSLNTTILGLNRHYIYISGGIALTAYIFYNICKKA